VNLRAAFESRFGATPHLWWAPGRVNLIGEHIDYCGGRVLPMPIQFGTTVAMARTATGNVIASSSNVADPLSLALGADTVELPSGHWGHYVRGAIALLRERVDVSGVAILAQGDLPGSGLSSSASLSVALLAAGADIFGLEIEGLELARLAQRIEHEYVGVACGLMDQAVIASGGIGAAYLFDCYEESGRAIELPGDAPEVLVVDSGKQRALVHSAYHARLEETGRAARACGIERRDLARSTVALPETLDPVARRRANHVRSEQHRVDAAVAAMARGEWQVFGELLTASHASLRDDFEVSCVELDRLVGLLQQQPTCLGARMTGAGFGGSVIALVERDRTSELLRAIDGPYRAATGRPAAGFVARSVGGVQRYG
jgi:galactokinase